jgi:hypothetical protein
MVLVAIVQHYLKPYLVLLCCISLRLSIPICVHVFSGDLVLVLELLSDLSSSMHLHFL